MVRWLGFAAPQLRKTLFRFDEIQKKTIGKTGSPQVGGDHDRLAVGREKSGPRQAIQSADDPDSGRLESSNPWPFR
jgi:hypothetical protein